MEVMAKASRPGSTLCRSCGGVAARTDEEMLKLWMSRVEVSPGARDGGRCGGGGGGREEVGFLPKTRRCAPVFRM